MRVFIILVVLLPFVFSCSENKHEKGVHLYKMQCAACHELPNIEHLPKSLWKDKVLPEMGARMGIKNTGFNPLSGFSFEEQHAILNSGVYSVEPQISEADWQLLKEYIVSTAPDSLILNNSQKQAKKLNGFELVPVDIDSVHGSSIVFTQFDTENSKLNIADLRGRIYEYREDTKTLKKILNGIGPISDFTEMDDVKYATSIGSLSPSEIANGKIFTIKDRFVQPIPLDFHRPVHTTVFDFNNDGEDEILVCEYGNLTGSLSLVVKSDDGSLEKNILLGQPGAIRTVVKDMNQDTKADIVVLTAQGNEGITILYQTENLEFKTEQVIRFSPLYGSSWFEMLDFDDDGDQDVVTLHGDNADRTQVLKPYHGLRIHLNDGANNFKEEFFYPLYGATRSVSADFDKDGDIDFGIVSTFPDYEGESQKSFVYLNNIDTNNFVFETQVIENDFQGRWFLMDSGDFDQDGDIDIALSCSTFNFNSVPADLSKIYKENPWDILVLKNRLIE
ncbi:FG-GAP repeat domain-containing protein [Zobellia russellii]|uniref:FG-GAP repeat domain-containing protein n=1 Tax=Zobellia russellii TaxID=248907 RepID=UPI0037DDC80A